MRRVFFLLTGFLFTITAITQPELKSRKGNEFVFADKSAQLKIDWCTPGMFRIRSSWNEPEETWMVVKYNWSPVSVTVFKQKDHVQLQSALLSVKLYSSPLRIEVMSKDGKVLSTE
ncbi:MAG: DUF4968 domain-containing protein, partial [Chitinophagaceae bacterium]|nr:DUF4968 domain-containing protein [Chitinophagaceae bacterium]